MAARPHERTTGGIRLRDLLEKVAPLRRVRASYAAKRRRSIATMVSKRSRFCRIVDAVTGCGMLTIQPSVECYPVHPPNSDSQRRASLGLMCGTLWAIPIVFAIFAMALAEFTGRIAAKYCKNLTVSNHRCLCRPGFSTGADSPAPIDLPSARGERCCDGSYPRGGCFCIGRAFFMRSFVQYPGLDGGAICSGASGRVAAL